MSKRTAVAFLVALTLTFAAIHPLRTVAQQAQNEELVRRARSKVQPQYPDLARKMNISGTVKIEVVVAPNGIISTIAGTSRSGNPVRSNSVSGAASGTVVSASHRCASECAAGVHKASGLPSCPPWATCMPDI